MDEVLGPLLPVGLGLACIAAAPLLLAVVGLALGGIAAATRRRRLRA